MEFSQLKKDLDKGRVQSLYVFTGEEREVMRKYINRIDPNYIEATNFQAIRVALQNKGLFAQSRTYVIRGDKKILEMDPSAILKQLGDNVTLILIYDKADERMKFFKAVKKDYLVDFKKFTEEQLIRTVIRELGVSEDYPDELAMVIARYCNNEVSRIENECHKLMHSAFAEINLEAINELIEPPAEDRIFDMMKAVAKREVKRAWELYSDLIDLRESPIKIISILYTQFKHLFLVQSMSGLGSKEIADKTGLSSWQVGQTKDLIDRFTLSDLVEKLKLIQRTEVQMKTGQIDIDTGMDNLLVTLTT